MSEQASTTFEQWRAIPNYEGVYSASSLGRIRRDTTGKILKAVIGSGGYLHLNLWRNNAVRSVDVHRIVLLSFLGENPAKPHANHKDGNKQNNALSNLEWCTPRENILHSLYVLRRFIKKPKIKKAHCYKRGEDHYAHRITAENVLEIHQMRRNGMTQSAIGVRFGIAQAHVSRILLGRKWRHIKPIVEGQRTIVP